MHREGFVRKMALISHSIFLECKAILHGKSSTLGEAFKLLLYGLFGAIQEQMRI